MKLTASWLWISLGYANGPGATDGVRPDPKWNDTTDKEYRQQATVLLDYETHGTEDVGT